MLIINFLINKCNDDKNININFYYELKGTNIV